jgi:hypothetical protein
MSTHCDKSNEQPLDTHLKKKQFSILHHSFQTQFVIDKDFALAQTQNLSICSWFVESKPRCFNWFDDFISKKLHHDKLFQALQFSNVILVDGSLVIDVSEK